MRSMPYVCFFSLSFFFLLTGCAHKEMSKDGVGLVNSGLLIPMGASRYEMEKNEIFLMADRLPGFQEPRYPQEYLGQDMDTRTVCVDLVVDSEGAVSSASINRTEHVCAGGGAPAAFEEAALESVREWQFFAAQICTYPDGVEPDARCEGEGVSSQLVPVRLTYVFEFSQAGGKSSVHSSLQGGAE